MKNFCIMGVHWKSHFFLGGGGGWFINNQYIHIGELPKKVGAWTVCKFKRELGKNEGGGVFDRGRYPNAHYDYGRNRKTSKCSFMNHHKYLFHSWINICLGTTESLGTIESSSIIKISALITCFLKQL